MQRHFSHLFMIFPLHNVRYESADAKTKALDRAREPEVKALLSTIRSGGVGLNLQEFNHVVFESRDLNPQKHKQDGTACTASVRDRPTRPCLRVRTRCANPRFRSCASQARRRM